MARVIQVKVLDGKQNTVDESRVNYAVSIPSDVLFFWKDNIQYVSFWNTNHELVQIPVSQVLSID